MSAQRFLPKWASVAAGALFALLAILYPFWAHWGLTHWGVGPVAGLLALAFMGFSGVGQ